MPIYLDLANLIIDKRAIEKKYKGGVEQFRIDYYNKENVRRDEDDEVFTLVRMNWDDFDIDRYIKMGFEWNEETESSNDFVIHQRYHGFIWKTDWINANEEWAWHINTRQLLKNKIEEFESITIDETLAIERSNEDYSPLLSLIIDNINTHKF